MLLRHAAVIPLTALVTVTSPGNTTDLPLPTKPATCRTVQGDDIRGAVVTGAPCARRGNGRTDQEHRR